VILLVMLLHITPFHSQQSTSADHEESTPDESMTPCLKLKRACMSCRLQRILMLQKAVLNMIPHSNHTKMIAY